MAGQQSLGSLADQFGSDKGNLHGERHNYAAVYDLIFFELRQRPIKVLELGLAIGGPEFPGVARPKAASSPSVDMWLTYFANASITGFDITDFSDIRHPRFRFIQGDLSRESDIIALAEAIGQADVIIDDASHASPHQQTAFKHLWPRLASGGIYIIEDLHWQSPVFENIVPGTPKTAMFFQTFFEKGIYIDNPILSAPTMRAVEQEAATYAMFPAFNHRPCRAKLMVLRKGA